MGRVAQASANRINQMNNPIPTSSLAYKSLSSEDLKLELTSFPQLTVRRQAAGLYGYLPIARYLRIYPSKTLGDGFLNFSRVQVFDSRGNDIAYQAPVVCSGTATGSAAPETVVSESTEPRAFPYCWVSSTGGRETTFFEIDFGSEQDIQYIVFMNRLDAFQSRSNGLRFQLLDKSRELVLEETPTNGEILNIISYCFRGIAGRYLVIRPPASGSDGYIYTRQLMVIEPGGNSIIDTQNKKNVFTDNDCSSSSLASNKFAFTLKSGVEESCTRWEFVDLACTRRYKTSANVSTLTNKQFNSTNSWRSPTNAVSSTFLAIDFGGNIDVGIIAFANNIATSSMAAGTRFELYGDDGNKVAECSLPTTSDTIQTISFLTPLLKRSYNNRKTPFDDFYAAFDEQQYVEPSVAETTIRTEQVARWGYDVSRFDVDVRTLPWDTDNKDIDPKDIMWGIIGENASKSIFEKVYKVNLAINRQLTFDPNKPQPLYRSPLFGVELYDQKAAVATQLAENMAPMIIGNALEEAPEFFVKKVIPITSRFAMGTIRGTLSLGRMIGSRALSIATMGVRPLSKLFAQRIAIAISRKPIEKAILFGAQAAAAVISFIPIIGQVFALAASALLAAINLASMIVDVFFALALMPIVNEILVEYVGDTGICQPGTRLTHEAWSFGIGRWFYDWIMSNLPAIGTILTMLEPYACYDDKYLPVLKVQPFFPEYLFDQSLSLYHKQIEDTSLDPVKGYRFPANRNEIPSTVKYCDFGDVDTVQRMIQYYNKNARLSFINLEDGRIEYKIITKIKGVIASSELSCDVRCEMLTVRHDAITGDGYEEIYGCTYEDDEWKEEKDCFRRFYFIKNIQDTDGKCTVTGSTNADYTAPDAMVHSYDTAEGAQAPVAVPRDMKVTAKGKMGENRATGLIRGYISTTAPMALAMAGGPLVGRLASSKGGILPKIYNVGVTQLGNAGLGAGFMVGAQKLVEEGGAFDKAMRSAFGNAPLDSGSSITQCVRTNDGWRILTDNSYYSIDQGPPPELATGITAEFNLCSNIKIFPEVCSDGRIVKQFTSLYHDRNPSKHIKVIHGIEPRDPVTPSNYQGCYYKFQETDFNAETNTESSAWSSNEVVLQFTQLDPQTCVFVPHEFSSNLTEYPLRKVNIQSINVKADNTAELIAGPDIYPTRIQPNGPGTVTNPATTLAFKYPRKPFAIPRPLPSSTLGGSNCTTTCKQKEQVEQLVKDFNDANVQFGRRILNVFGAWTPTAARCDFDVMMSRQNGSKESIGRETVRIDVIPDTGLNAKQCIFRRVRDYSSQLNSGTYIQKYKAEEYGYDISGGMDAFTESLYKLDGEVDSVPTFTSFLSNATTALNKVKAFLIGANVEKNIDAPVNVLDEQTQKVLAANLRSSSISPGCPDVKCSNPSILNAFVTGYNSQTPITDVYNVERNTVRRILKAVRGSANSCDILYEYNNEFYDSYVNMPTYTRQGLKASRVYLTSSPTNPCEFSVSTAAGAIEDIPETSKSLTQAEAQLANVYTPCELDCSAPAITSAVKRAAEENNIRNGYKPAVYSYVAYSLSTGPTQCEYKIRKTLPNDETSDTFVQAKLKLTTTQTSTGVTCSYTIQTPAQDVLEFDPVENVKITNSPTQLQRSIDLTTGQEIFMMNGVRVQPPVVLSIDATQLSDPTKLSPYVKMGYTIS
jgi:hypothetical protein